MVALIDYLIGRNALAAGLKSTSVEFLTHSSAFLAMDSG